MNRFRNLTAFFAFALLILALPTLVSAQWNNRNDDDDYYRNNRNSNRNLQSTIKNLKNRSHEFEHRLDRELDRSRYDDRQREDRILHLAQDFKDAAAHLNDAYNNRRDYNNSQDEARQVLELGSQLDRAISRLRISSNVSSDWNRISQDLRVLANAYNYGYNNNRRGNRNDDYDDDDYNRNNRNNRTRRTNTDWRRHIPFPLPF